MKNKNLLFGVAMALLAFSSATAQNNQEKTVKVKTMKIINNDTTITEEMITEKELAEREKEFAIRDDRKDFERDFRKDTLETGKKRIVKKEIIKVDKKDPSKNGKEKKEEKVIIKKRIEKEDKEK